MKETGRSLTKHELALLRPEIMEYIQGQQAQERLGRMLGLFAPGCDIDVAALTLVREVPDPAPTPALEELPAESA